MQWLSLQTSYAEIITADMTCSDYHRRHYMQWLSLQTLYAVTITADIICNDYHCRHYMQWLSQQTSYAMTITADMTCSDYHCRHDMQWLSPHTSHAVTITAYITRSDYHRRHHMQWLSLTTVRVHHNRVNRRNASLLTHGNWVALPKTFRASNHPAHAVSHASSIFNRQGNSELSRCPRNCKITLYQQGRANLSMNHAHIGSSPVLTSVLTMSMALILPQ